MINPNKTNFFNKFASFFKRPKKHKLLWLKIFIVLVFLSGVGCVSWYYYQLSSVDKDSDQTVQITINPGTSPTKIGEELQDKSVIRNAFAFNVYLRVSGKINVLKAGFYNLSPADSVQQIVEHLIHGSTKTFNITFYPGAILKDNSDKPDSQKTDVFTVLSNAGYSESEINSAFSATYNGKLFDNKPATADLEGYVFGETYNFNEGVTVKEILQRTFDEFYKKIYDNNLINKFESHGLNLYQAITLASIIQREVSNPADQKQVAQVFYKRMELGMALGSDVTYQYIADKMGITRDPGIDSPYNTRMYAGLPPGPISAPGLSALLAVADPAKGDYLYFLSGDDGLMYYAYTNEEHESNIVDHCAINCSTP